MEEETSEAFSTLQTGCSFPEALRFASYGAKFPRFFLFLINRDLSRVRVWFSAGWLIVIRASSHFSSLFSQMFVFLTYIASIRNEFLFPSNFLDAELVKSFNFNLIEKKPYSNFSFAITTPLGTSFKKG